MCKNKRQCKQRYGNSKKEIKRTLKDKNKQTNKNETLEQKWMPLMGSSANWAWLRKRIVELEHISINTSQIKKDIEKNCPRTVG